MREELQTLQDRLQYLNDSFGSVREMFVNEELGEREEDMFYNVRKVMRRKKSEGDWEEDDVRSCQRELDLILNNNNGEGRMDVGGDVSIKGWCV